MVIWKSSSSGAEAPVGTYASTARLKSGPPESKKNGSEYPPLHKRLQNPLQTALQKLLWEVDYRDAGAF